MRSVNEVLQRKGDEVYWIDPLASVYDALREMQVRNCGALCVMIDGYLVGIVSERDYVRHVILDRKASQQTKVSEIMTRDVIKVSRSDTIDHCLELMEQHRFRHLPVVEEGRVLGVLSLRDLFVEAIAALKSPD
ncbi:MAG: CBS domain-containing protein [Pseudomonadota bacterium]